MPANPNFDDIVTTTLRNRSGKLADNATETTVLLDRLRRKGKVSRLAVVAPSFRSLKSH